MRKEKIWTAVDGRDVGKQFYIKEMPATQAEKWALRALLGLAKAGVDIPEGIEYAGMAGVYVVGIRALGGIAYADAEQLMEEMFACIQRVPDPTKPKLLRALVEDDIEEVATRLRLRSEVFELHTGFSVADALSRQTQDSPSADSSSTPMSPEA